MTNTDPGRAGDMPYPSKRELRHARRAARQHMMQGWAGPSIGGLVLVIIGVVLLLQNFGYQLPPRWWALLLLIPAVGSLVAAIRIARAGVGYRGEAVLTLVAAVIFTALSLSLFFDLGWGLLWPILLVVVGGAIIVRSMARNRRG